MSTVAPQAGGQQRGTTALPSPGEKRAAVEEMFDGIASRYELLNTVLTGGLDRWWRRRAVAELGLGASSTVLDVACGTGDLCRQLRAAGLQPTGVDLSGNMLRHANTDAALLRGDALSLPMRDGAFDGATCGFGLRNFTDVASFFRELARVVRPGGRVALVEVDTPANPLMRAGHRFYFGKVVPTVGALLSDGAAYRYLPESVAYLPGAGELQEMAAAAGFLGFAKQRLGGGAAQLVSATRGPEMRGV